MEMTPENQMFVKLLTSFSRKHDLGPIASMLLPGLFRKASVETDIELLEFTRRSLKIAELGDYLAGRARVLAETDKAKELWEEHLQEGAA